MPANYEYWDNIPQDFKQHDRWCVAAADKAPSLVTNGRLHNLDWCNFNNLLSFKDACKMAYTYGLDVAIALNKEMGLTCIDLDVKDIKDGEINGHLRQQQDRERIDYILGQFKDTYAEYSRSGNGYHIWVRGYIGAGRRRQNVEVYSQERVMIMTGKRIPTCGDQLIAMPERISALASQLNSTSEGNEKVSSRDIRPELDKLDQPQQLNDLDLFNCAVGAVNGDKFRQLYNGEWLTMGCYQSQSEADSALMTILAFYSKNNDQCRRVFRMSALGHRDKAVKNDVYLDRTLLNIRHKEKPRVDFSKLIANESNKQLNHIESRVKEQLVIEDTKPVEVYESKSFQVSHYQEVSRQKISEAKSLDINDAVVFTEEVFSKMRQGITFEPRAGTWFNALVHDCFRGIRTPILQMALCVAFSIIQAICGRAYSVSNTGLNGYTVFLGRSGSGKDSINKLIRKFFTELDKRVNGASNFLMSSRSASPQGLFRNISLQPSAIECFPEASQLIADVFNKKGDQGLLNLLLSAYDSSDVDGSLLGIKHAKSQSLNDMERVASPAYSFIGESVPSKFWDCLDLSSADSGFLSRLNIVTYEGETPLPNDLTNYTISEEVLNHLQRLCVRAIEINNINSIMDRIKIETAPNANNFYEQFRLMSTRKTQEYEAQEAKRYSAFLWTRANLKAYRTAGQMAAMENPEEPLITLPIMKDAIEFTLNCIFTTQEHFEGEYSLDEGEHKGEEIVRTFLKEYRSSKIPKSYNITPEMQKNNVVPLSYIRRMVIVKPYFNKHKFGASRYRDIIRDLEKSKELIQVPANNNKDVGCPNGASLYFIDLA